MYVATLTAGAVLYALSALLLFGPVARVWLGPKYAQGLWMVPFLGFVLVMNALGNAGIGLILRADHRPKAIFVATMSGAGVVAVILFPLCRFYGVGGLLYCSCAAAATQFCVYVWFLVREIRRPDRRLLPDPMPLNIGPAQALSIDDGI